MRVLEAPRTPSTGDAFVAFVHTRVSHPLSSTGKEKMERNKDRGEYKKALFQYFLNKQGRKERGCWEPTNGEIEPTPLYHGNSSRSGCPGEGRSTNYHFLEVKDHHTPRGERFVPFSRTDQCRFKPETPECGFGTIAVKSQSVRLDLNESITNDYWYAIGGVLPLLYLR